MRSYKVIDEKRQQGLTSFFELKNEHSIKPAKMQEMIMQVSYPPYCELFARHKIRGWTAFGNETDGTNFLEI